MAAHALLVLHVSMIKEARVELGVAMALLRAAGDLAKPG